MTTTLVICCGGTIGGARPATADLTGLSSHFMRRGRRRPAFEAWIRTAPATVRRALTVSEEAR